MPSIYSISIKLSFTIFSVFIFILTLTPVYAGGFNPKSFMLENGMQVILIENHRAPVVSHMVWYRVGAADEPQGKSGISHFLEHLMFTGTDKIPPNSFSKIIKKHGGQDNAFTSQDYTAYYQNIAVEKLPLVMEMEADRMQNLKITEEVVKRERNVILEERNQRIDNNPSAILGEAVNAALFVNHPYANPIIGWQHEIENLSLKDALEFYKKYYRPNNAILVVAGDIKLNELKELANKYYGKLKNPKNYPHKYVRNWTKPAPIKTKNKIIYEDTRIQAPVYQRVYRAERGSHALEILSNILGEDSTSILYKKLLVEKKLVTSIGSSYDPMSYAISDFTIYFQPAPNIKIKTVEKEIDKIINQLINNSITEDELKTAKKKLISSAIYARDSLQYPAMIFGRALTAGFDINYVENWTNNIEKLTIADITKSIKTLFRDDNKPIIGILMPKTMAEVKNEK